MTTQNIPVSFELFKKFTYHEEWISLMLKIKTKGDQQMYDRLVNNKEVQERALRTYYEAFYLKPIIREKYHIRFKSAPKSIKEKLLSIPKQEDTNAVNKAEQEQQDQAEDITEIYMKDVVKDLDLNRNTDNISPNKIAFKKRILLLTQNVFDEECMAEDDNEPAYSPNASISSHKVPAKETSSSEKQNNKVAAEAVVSNCHQEINETDKPRKTSDMLGGKDEKLTLEHQHNAAAQINTTSADIPSCSSADSNTGFNYKAWIPYLHCCPLSYREFRQYTNIDKLVAETYETKNIYSADQIKKLLHRCHLLFYLAPEHRKNSPLNRIQLTENCPIDIKNKFFDIPTKLYLKEKSDANKLTKNQCGVEKSPKVSSAENTHPKTDKQLAESVIKSSEQNSELTAAKTTSSPSSTINAENVAKTCTVAKANSNENNCVPTKESIETLIQQEKNKNTNSNKNKETEAQLILGHQQKTTTTTTNTLECREENNKSSPAHQHHTASGDSDLLHPQSTTTIVVHKDTVTSSAACEGVIKLPVSLEDFKKFTYYEEAVRNLLKLKTQNDENLYLKYCNNKKAFDDTTMKYYRAFYLLPAIRDIYPIRLKSMPKFMKNLLLQVPVGVFQIPLDASTLKQLILPDIINIEEDVKEALSSANEGENANKPVEPMVTDTIVVPKTAPSSLSAAGNSVSSRQLKRTNNEDVAVDESLSPKRKKMEERPDYALLSCKDLLRYELCCPVSYSNFAHYTNLAELFTRHCQKTYNSLKKLPLMLKRAYILFYLEPVQRNLQPFSKLKVLDACPPNIKEKLFEFPAVEEIAKITAKIQDHEQSAEKAKDCAQISSRQPNNGTQKPIIEILENRLLAPILEESVAQSMDKSLSCPTKRIKDTTNNIQTKQVATTTTKTVDNAKDNLSSPTKRTQDTTNNVQTKQVVIDTQTVDNSRQDHSSSQQAGHVTNNVPTKQVLAPKATQIIDIWQNERLFSRFCQKLSAKLQQSLDGSIDFSSECYKIFLECNYIPLKEFLRDTCENNDEIVQSILNKKELYEVLQRYYYFKYMTNEEFASKYPLKAATNELQRKEATNSGVLNETQQPGLNSSSSSSSSSGKPATQTKNLPDEAHKDVSLHSEKSTNINSALEKAKHIFFRCVDKTNTLAYVLRTTFEYKQAILRAILDLTFDEFIELTSVYEGKDLYADRHLAECMYRYVCRKPFVWPTNLFMTLENLCNFLRKNDIYFDDCSTMLFHISPKILHWSNLLECTNFLNCVKCDYKKRTGKLLDTDNHSNVEQECINYYNRCWKYEKWLGDTPLLNDEFCKMISDHNIADDAMITDEQPTTVYCNNADNEAAGNDAEAAKGQDIIVLSPSQMNRIADDEEESNETNYVGLPSTQQQIEMLPDEQNAHNDPLNNSVMQQPIKTEPLQTKLLSNLMFHEDENGEIQCTACEEEIIELDVTVQNSTDLAWVNSDFLGYNEQFPFLMMQHIPSGVASNDTNTQQPSYQCDQMVQSQDSNCLNSLLEQHISSAADSSDNTQQPPFQAAQMMQLQDANILSNETLEPLLVQHIPSAADSNASHIQQSFFQCSQMVQSQDVSALSSLNKAYRLEDATAKNFQILEPQLIEMGSGVLPNNCTILKEAPPLSSTFEEPQKSNENPGKSQEQDVAKKASKSIKEIIDTVLAEKGKQQAIEMSDKPSNVPHTSKTSCKSSYHANTRKTKLPKYTGTPTSKVASKTKKNVATVKPLPHSNLVPQIQHNTRPLQTVPALTATATSSHNNPAPQTTESQIVAPNSFRPLQTVPALTANAASSHNNPAPQTTESQIVAPTSFMFNLTPSSGSQNSSGTSSQNSSIQLQLPPFGTHIYISQELNNNCSVFDNSSVLRIVDNNFGIEQTPHPVEETHQQQSQQEVATCGSNSTYSDNVHNTGTSNEQLPMHEENVQTACRVTRNRKSLSHCSQQPYASDSQQQQQEKQQETCRKIVSSRISNLYKNINDMVNKLTPANNSNVITSITITINQQQQQEQTLHRPTTQMEHKVFLYRGIYKFHYFKELTSQHMSKYLLPSLQIGKSYSEALVVCENFKTRISNRSISALFPFWSSALQRDFLLVLDELREFHYNVFERRSMQKQEDLRARILYWLLDTAPAFSLCQFVYEKNNTEFSHCEAIQGRNDTSYKRKPFKCLTKALDSKLLKRLQAMKKDRNLTIS